MRTRCACARVVAPALLWKGGISRGSQQCDVYEAPAGSCHATFIAALIFRLAYAPGISHQASRRVVGAKF